MNDDAHNDDVLVQYLLGDLPEDEQQQIEQRIFADDDFYERVLEVEEDLRCAYAQGTMPLAAKTKFEKRFLIFADERERVQLAREIIDELPKAVAGRVLEQSSLRFERRTRHGLFGRLREGPRPALRYAMAAAALIVIAGLLWLVFETVRLRNQINQLRSQRTTIERQVEQRSEEERARIEQLNKELSEERDRRGQLEEEIARRDHKPAAPQSFVAMLLSPGLIRGGGETKRLVLPSDTDQVRLMLTVTGNTSNNYRVVLMNSEGKELWSRQGLTTHRDGTRIVLACSIPSRLIAEADYELKLSGLDDAGRPERTDSYYFTVLKK
jgi:anti-sigma-K factor RskA